MTHKILPLLEPLVDHYMYPDILRRLEFTNPDKVFTWGEVHSQFNVKPIPRELLYTVTHVNRPNNKSSSYNLWLLEMDNGDYVIKSLEPIDICLNPRTLEYTYFYKERMPQGVLTAIHITVGDIYQQGFDSGIELEYYEKI